MFKIFEKMFGKDKPEVKFYTSLKIGLHSTIEINTVDLLLFMNTPEGMNQNVVLPSGKLSVNAISRLFGNDGEQWRIYVADEKDEEFILLISEDNGKVNEVNLWKQTFIDNPETEGEWDRFFSGIGYETLDFDNHKYTRLWGNKHTEKTDLREFIETIYTNDGHTSMKDQYILYARDVKSITGDTMNELLLVGVEEEDNYAQVVFQVGYNIDPNTIKVDFLS